ncbi:MAG: cytochrome c oxidase subunit II [Proteobacteria bacterium]|nr:MAG: cytochrome c oxidase subunit II [Pseudomonadota bacterium]
MIKKQTIKGFMVGSLLMSTVASAEYGMNLTKGVSDYSGQVYDMHMLVLWICVIIGIGVFGAMFYSIFAHRKSKGVEPAQFSHSTTVEIIWTAIPVLILIAIALPATKGMMQMDSPRDSQGEPVTMDMTVKITGYQWKWRYDYLDEGFGFLSTLTADSNIARQKGSGINVNTVDNYLLDVDNPLVIPANTNIRFLLTSDDVIHSWWVPEFGWKRDAIPGFINEAWTHIKQPGTYRGQCAELCGKDHGYMPIVVEVLSESDYASWVAEQNGETSTVQSAEVVEQSQDTFGDDPIEVEADQVTDLSATAAVSDHEEVQDEEVADNQNEQQDSGWSMEQLMTRGEEVYNTQCLACHKIDGSGMPPAFPSLAGSAVVVGDLAKQIDVVVNGVPGTGMMPFGSILPAEDIAATITYTRNAFGNDVGDRVQPADIEAAKQ